MTFCWKKRALIYNHSKFPYPCHAYSFETINDKLNPAFKRNFFYEHLLYMSLRKSTMFACSCKLRRCWVTYTSVNEITRSRDCYWLRRYICPSSSTNRILYHAARYSNCIQRAVQFVYHMFILGSQRRKRASRNSFKFVWAFFKGFLYWCERISSQL